MNPQQALEFLKNVTENIQATRSVHNQIATAISVLASALANQPQVRDASK